MLTIRIKQSFFSISRYSSYLSSSYLDIFICDCRLHIANVNNNINCLETFDYDSDYKAIQMNIAFKSNAEFKFFKEEEIIKYYYNGTNWKTFNKKITKLSTKEINIPNSIFQFQFQFQFIYITLSLQFNNMLHINC